MPNEHFCLKWNNFQRNIVAALGNLKLDEDFVDVTISCEGGKLIKAHKVILSACSDYFRDLFRVRHSLYIRFRRIFQLNLELKIHPFFSLNHKDLVISWLKHTSACDLFRYFLIRLNGGLLYENTPNFIVQF